MARGFEGPIDIGGSGRSFRIPSLPQHPGAGLRVIAIGILVAVLLFTGYDQVEPDEVAVVQRFGRLVRVTEPGPHLQLPFGIETVKKVPVQQQLKMEFGFRTAEAGVRTRYEAPSDDSHAEASMLTGDLNVAQVEWIVQFRIKDPRAWLFHVRDVERTFRAMSEAAMREVVGDHSVDEVLTIGRESIAAQAKERLQALCDRYAIGIEVQQLVLQNVNPPDPVKPAFNEVNQAIQEKERAINEAWAEYNKAVPRAKGEADQAVHGAEGYAVQRVNNAQGEADRFQALYEEYHKAPAVTRRRIYLETMARLLPKLGRKVIVDEKARGVLPLLQVGESPAEAKP